MFYNKDGSSVSFVTVTNIESEAIDAVWKLSPNYNPTDLEDQEDIYLLIKLFIGKLLR